MNDNAHPVFKKILNDFFDEKPFSKCKDPDCGEKIVPEVFGETANTSFYLKYCKKCRDEFLRDLEARR